MPTLPVSSERRPHQTDEAKVGLMGRPDGASRPRPPSLYDENVALVARLTSLRGLVEQLTTETAEVRRRLRQVRAENREVRAENRELRAALADCEHRQRID